MRRHVAVLAVVLAGLATPARALSEPPAEAPRTAEQFIETARKAYTVEEPDPEPCPTATNNEIVVCREYREDESQDLQSPTERAYAAGERPPDPIPDAPDVFGLPPCSASMFCTKVGRAPPPIYIIDLSKIPEALTPEEAALVFRAEDRPENPANPEAASPAAAP